MKRAAPALFAFLAVLPRVSSQDAPIDPFTFRDSIDIRSTLADLSRAIDDFDRLGALSSRILLLDGVVDSVLVFADEPDEYYAEMEIVNGRWDGLADVEIYRAFVVINDPQLAGIVAERAPRDTAEPVILRGDRVLVAAQLVDRFAMEDGSLVPVLIAYDLRELD